MTTTHLFLALGTPTPWGRIAAMGYMDGEGWYMMVKGNLVTLMPAPVLEAMCKPSV